MGGLGESVGLGRRGWVKVDTFSSDKEEGS